jgi:glucosyl-dolichyl phosphate glucuronosyltransferase
MASLPHISVIVPTFNRGASLQRLLGSLGSIELPDSILAELIIVDNGSTDNTGEILLREQGGGNRFDFRVAKENTKGKSSALNQGIGLARGEILIVVDDDVVVHHRWMTEHWECHRVYGFGAVQGRVLPGVDPQGCPADPSRLREYNIPIVDYGRKIRPIRGFTGTNVSFKRDIVRQVGLFNPRLGPGALGFSEDTEYSIRMRRAGFKIGYDPGAVVYHELNPERYGRAYNRRVEYRKGISRSIYRQDSIWFKVLPDLMAQCVRYGIYRLLGKSQKAYQTEGRILKSWGYLSGKLGSSNLADSASGSFLRKSRD